MDSLAVCICQAMCRKQFVAFRAIKIAFIFGMFQALMPLIGYYLGAGFNEFIALYDHWFAFGILFLLGLKMAFDSLKSNEKEQECYCSSNKQDSSVDWKKVVILAIATSIDALVAGVIFVPHPQSLSKAIISIGVVCFLFTFAGIYVGSNFGKKIRFNLTMIGGIILMSIGVKILLEHTIQLA